MSEELNGAAVAQTPATETTTAQAPVTPEVTPEAKPAPSADLGNVEPSAPVPAPVDAPTAVADQATIDQANGGGELPPPPVSMPTPLDGNGEPAEPLMHKQETPTKPASDVATTGEQQVPGTGTPTAEAATAEQPQPAAPAFEVTDELVEKAKAIIIKTRKSGPAVFQRGLNIGFSQALQIINKLVELGVLGEQKDGKGPRQILIELHAPAQRPNQKPRLSEEDRIDQWKKHLAEIGKYTDEKFIAEMAKYASKNPGYNPRARWGACLIVMINRLHGQLLNRIPSFTAADAEYIQHELLKFFSEKPLGDSPAKWVQNYTSNMDQKHAVGEFFGINCSYRDMRGQSKIAMTAIRDAPWPNKEEEQKGTGGSYAERFHYLALAVIRMCNDGYAEALFGGCYHNEPTDEFLQRVGGGKIRRRETADSWITADGKCALCGGDVIKDSDGNNVCSNPICEHNIARVSTDAPASFRFHNKPDLPQGMEAAPMPTEDRRRNWKKNKFDRRHNDGDERGFEKKHGKKRGPRYHMNEAEEQVNEVFTGSIHIGGEMPKNNPFACLTVPTAEAPAAPENPEAV